MREWLCQVINPIALLNKASKIHQRYWSPAYGILPRWHHNLLISDNEKPAHLTHLTLTVYTKHSEFHAIFLALKPLLADYGVELTMQEISYSRWYEGDAKSDLWLGSANFTCRSNSRFFR